MYGVELSLIRNLVSSGQAGTFLIKELADTWPEVVTVPLTEKIPITFSLVWRKDKFQNKKTHTLIEHILLKSGHGPGAVSYTHLKAQHTQGLAGIQDHRR